MKQNERTFSDAGYLALGLMVGLLAGVAGGYFHRLIDWLAQWPQWLSGQLAGWPLVLAGAIITMLATVLTVWWVRRFAPEASGSGVQEVEGAMEDLRTVHWYRVLPVKFIGGVLSISSGLVLGREGPTIHIGASVAAAVARVCRVVAGDRKGLLAAGAGAGLACAFNAPVAAMLFVTEEMRRQFPFSFRNYSAVALACIMATVVAQWVGGSAPDLRILHVAGTVPLASLPAFVGVGVVLGGLGVCLNAMLLRNADFSAYCQRRLPYGYPAVVGLVIGALLMSYPLAVTGGESLVTQFGAMPPGVGMLLVLVLVRFFTTTASYATGVPGGIFAPILALGMCVGLAFGAGCQMLLPEGSLDPVTLGIAAMGGLFAASVHAPTVGIVLIAELTGTYGLLLPLAMTCFVAQATARWLGGRPIYELLLERTLKASSGEVTRS